MKETNMTLTESEIREAIFHLEDCVSSRPDVVKTALSVLNHALTHGLAMGESDTAEAITKHFCSNKKWADIGFFISEKDEDRINDLASAIVARQKELLK